MTYEDVYELGWKYEYKDKPKGIIKMGNECFFIEEDKCRWIMGLYLEKRGTYNVMINYVDEKVDHNEWENSETNFYGSIRDKDDLSLIMRFIHINELI